MKGFLRRLVFVALVGPLFVFCLLAIFSTIVLWGALSLLWWVVKGEEETPIDGFVEYVIEDLPGDLFGVVIDWADR